jgi:hypothetical protein
MSLKDLRLGYLFDVIIPEGGRVFVRRALSGQVYYSFKSKFKVIQI